MIRKKKITKDSETQEFKVTPIEEENPEAFSMQPEPISATEEDELEDDEMEGSYKEADDKEQEESDSEMYSVNQKGKISITFGKFIRLLTSHNFEEIMGGHEKKEVIIDVDLLADLANSHNEEPDKRVPVFFILGLFIGAIVVFVLVKFFS